MFRKTNFSGTTNAPKKKKLKVFFKTRENTSVNRQKVDARRRTDCVYTYVCVEKIAGIETAAGFLLNNYHVKRVGRCGILTLIVQIATPLFR